MGVVSMTDKLDKLAKRKDSVGQKAVVCRLYDDIISQVDTHYTSQSPSGDVPQTWVAKSASWHINDPVWKTTWKLDLMVFMCHRYIYRLITAYLLLRVNLDKIMHARWDFDASSARTWRVNALDKHQNWSASALFCLNSRAQSKYAVVNLIHTRRKQTFLSFIMWEIRHFGKFRSHLNITNKI